MACSVSWDSMCWTSSPFSTIDEGTSQVTLDRDCVALMVTASILWILPAACMIPCFLMSLTIYLCTPNFQTICVYSSNFPSLLLYTSKKWRKYKAFSSNPGARGKSVLITNSSISSMQDFILELIILISPICRTDFGSKALNKDLCDCPFSTYPAACVVITSVWLGERICKKEVREATGLAQELSGPVADLCESPSPFAFLFYFVPRWNKWSCFP